MLSHEGTSTAKLETARATVFRCQRNAWSKVGCVRLIGTIYFERGQVIQNELNDTWQHTAGDAALLSIQKKGYTYVYMCSMVYTFSSGSSNIDGVIIEV